MSNFGKIEMYRIDVNQDKGDGHAFTLDTETQSNGEYDRVGDGARPVKSAGVTP